MFKFLKEKLKKAASKFSRQVKESIEEPEIKPKKEKKAEIKKEVKPEKETVFEKIKEKLKKKEEKYEEIKVRPKVEKPKIEKKPEKPKPVPKPVEVKKEIKEKPKIEVKEEKPKPGFFKKVKEKITKTTISEERFNDMFWDLELALLENNVAVEVIEKIKQDLSNNLVNVPIQRRGIEDLIKNSLVDSISELFDVEKLDLIGMAKEKKPFVIAFVGVNGVGKTTTIAKVAKLFEKNNMKCVLAAADTFRTAAIEQLQEHADKLGVKLIKHDYGADAAAVAFDAVKHAESKGLDVVLIDTAGRMHSNVNLMDEMKKIIRVSKPDLKVFVGESITGNDCTEQAKRFNEAIGIDGIILSKADVDEKGGAAISVSYVTKKPILFLGVGQEYKDLQKFNPSIIMQSLEL